MTTTWTGGLPRTLVAVPALILFAVVANLAAGQTAAPRNIAGAQAAGRSESRAAAIFRSAAALQDRELFDLAAAEWASLIDQYSDDPLIGKARHYRGVCLVRLDRFGEAEAEFVRVIADHSNLEPALLEQTFANLGFAQYNRARSAKGTERDAAFDSAIATLGQQLDRFPQGRLAAEAQYFRAEAYYARQQLSAAIDGYRAVLDKYPNHSLRPAALYGLGAAAQEHGQPEVAGRVFDDLLADFPDHGLAADAHFRRGEVFASLEQFSAAAAHFLAAGQAAGYAEADRARGMLVAVAQAAHAKEERETAIEVASRFIESFPKDSRLDEVYFLRGQCLAESDDTLAAIRDFTRVAEYWPASARAPDALLQQTQLEQNRGDFATIQVLIGRFLVNYREHRLAPHAHLLRATARYEMMQYAQAIDDIAAALDVKTAGAAHRADALFLRGLCETKLNRPEAATETFQSILKQDANYARGDRVLYELAGVYESINEPRQAAWAYRRIVAEFEPSALCTEAHYRIGQWQYNQQEYPAAANSFARCRERATDPQLREKAAHQLGRTDFSQQEFREAEKAFAQQLAEFPNGAFAADARVMVAECKFQCAEYGAALPDFSSALAANHAGSKLVETALLHAAEAASNIKEWSQAAKLLERFLREFPDSSQVAGARCKRGVALFQLKQLDAAREDFEVVGAVDDRVLQAQARFMLGEIHFANKQYDDAVRAFFQVAYGTDDAKPSSIERWQADSLFEAARCLEQTERLAAATKLYHELLERFPESEKTQHARVALQDLKKRLR